ncbi:hypothetical protein DOTSEDRAFT_83877 [Dothistroma septosporum NZE10]|uniref:Pentacotripeptide-repeat region of PRORP domain-containing protein n=1 Tax=Dothistroma septosporum (strain NZE10 / CBS 128990) TaxID=675120 RepID=N1PDK1_DOTSN|nr:hypothetical protein DOTSEDRAFT_83877 [Dothistroma septosporum NZE10]
MANRSAIAAHRSHHADFDGSISSLRRKLLAEDARLQEVSQWRLGDDCQETPNITVKRIVPAIAPARAPPQTSGVEYRQLNIKPYQRFNAAYRAHAKELAAASIRRAERQKRYMERRTAQADDIETRKLKIAPHQRPMPIGPAPGRRRTSKERRIATCGIANENSMADSVALAELSRWAGNEVMHLSDSHERRHSATRHPSRVPYRSKRLQPVTVRSRQGSNVQLQRVKPSQPAWLPPRRFGRGMLKWNTWLARLQRRFDKHSPRTVQVVEPPQFPPAAEAWAKAALSARGHLQMQQLRFDAGSQPINLHRSWYWQQTALWILYHDPERMVDFLLNTRQFTPNCSLQPVLQHLADRFTYPQDDTCAKNAAALADAFPRLADRGEHGPLHMKSSFLRLLMPYCSHDQINELYRATKVNQVVISWSTWLHFATHLARSGQFEQALDAIIESSLAGAELDSIPFRSTCATLLRAAIREPSGLRVCLRVVDNLVKLGVTLNIQLCNIVMLNAVEAGDQRTAFAVYNSLVEHGLQADAYTYAILLKGCKAAIDDAEGLNTTIRHAIEHIGVAHEPVVATEIIHCLALHHSKHHPERAFDTLADAYAQLFDLEPLRQLSIVLPHLSARLRPDAERMQPPKHVVHIMIAAHLEHTFGQTRSTAIAYQLYRRFLALADAGIQPFRDLIRTDHAANAFMMTFGKTKKGLPRAAEVIKDMQRESHQGCGPTVQTWTIFLHSFTKHGQMKLAEQVLTYMKDKGMSPNQVTWNVLTAGYATAQDVDGTLDALRRMEADSKVWDRWTEGGLKNLKDQQALAESTQSQYTKRLQMDVDADLKDRLLERISSADEVKVEDRQVDDIAEECVDGMADSPGDLAEAEKVVRTVYTPL